MSSLANANQVEHFVEFRHLGRLPRDGNLIPEDFKLFMIVVDCGHKVVGLYPEPVCQFINLGQNRDGDVI